MINKIQCISFEINAFEQYSDWAIFHKDTFKKISRLINDILRNPYEGLGKPEALKYQLSGLWSRRIDEKNRLIYKITEDEKLIIYSCKVHYDND